MNPKLLLQSVWAKHFRRSSAPASQPRRRGAGEIECLEARIAPATLLGPKVLSYHDTDGDLVRVTFSKALLTSANITKIFRFSNHIVNGQLDQQLQLLNLDAVGAAANAVNLTFTVTAGPNGNGLADVGFLLAGGLNLGTVSIHGDLGRISAGAGSPHALGVGALDVHSMGAKGVTTQAAGGTLGSAILGGLGSLDVTENFTNAMLGVGGKGTPARGTIGSITIGGSLIGGAASGSGTIVSSGAIGPVQIGGDVQGGGGTGSGTLGSSSTIGTVGITGSILGGDGQGSGAVHSTSNMGQVTIGGDLVGGTAANSGAVATAGALAGITITGQIKGGSDSLSGVVLVTGNLGAVQVDGGLLGGDGQNSGVVATAGTMTSFTGGDIIGGAGNGSGSFSSGLNIGTVQIASLQGGGGTDSGKITAGGTLGDVTVTNNITGGANTPISIQSGSTAGSISAGTITNAGLQSGGDFGDLTTTGAITGSTVNAAGGIGKITATSTDAIAIDSSHFSTGNVNTTNSVGAQDIGDISATGGISASSFRALGDLGTITATAGVNTNSISASGFNAHTSIGDVDATGSIDGSLFATGVQMPADFADNLSGTGTAAGGFGGANPNGDFNSATIGNVKLTVPSGATTAVISNTTLLAGVDFSGGNGFGQGDDFVTNGSIIGNITAPGGLSTVFIESGSVGNFDVTAGQISQSLVVAQETFAGGIGTLTVKTPVNSRVNAIESSTFNSSSHLGDVSATAPGGNALKLVKLRAVGGFGDITAVATNATTAVESTIFTSAGNIGNIVVTGAVHLSEFLAGVDLGRDFSSGALTGGGGFAGATVGTVTVSGQFLGSDLIASVLPTLVKSTFGNQFQNVDNNVGSGGSIGRVQLDTAHTATSFFIRTYNNSGETNGIEAAIIASVTVQGTNVPVASPGSELHWGSGSTFTAGQDLAIRQIVNS